MIRQTLNNKVRWLHCLLLGVLGISAVSFPMDDDPINVQLNGVPAIQQPTGNTCWATAATMLKSWKDSQSDTIADVMKTADANSGSAFGFATRFAKDQALPGSTKPDFLKALGLKAEGPQTFSAQGWADLLKKGPLWVTTNEGTQQNFAVHARIMIGIAGDGAPDSTFITFNDPADGKKHTETLAVFTKKMEEVAKLDLGEGVDLRPQVVHF